MIFACVMAVAGCQSKARLPARSAVPETEYEAIAASALVFDPPVAQDQPALALSRADREAGVAVGYEELTAEYFSIRFDDRQISNGFGFHGSGGIGNYDSYERRAVTHRVGVRYR